jgi:transcriptional/translational regulatory protein YebC/TACO1
VSFQFDRIGQIRYGADAATEEAMLEAAIEAGAEDCQSSEDGHEITCAPDDLASVTEALEARFGAPEAALLTWRPQVTVPVEDDKAETLFKLLETLDESDDVQRVVANFEVSESAMAKLST